MTIIDSNSHLCPKQCILYRDFLNVIINDIGDCNHYCNLPYNHDGNCNCGTRYPCNKKCKFYPNSGGCNSDCSKEYLHYGDCICSVERKYHLCREKCNLCEEMCGHVYNHENEKNIDCSKCSSNCRLDGQGHLCGSNMIAQTNVKKKDIVELKASLGVKKIHQNTKQRVETKCL